VVILDSVEGCLGKLLLPLLVRGCPLRLVLGGALVLGFGVRDKSAGCVWGGKLCIFANSPTGATIFDGGTWERSDVKKR